MPKKRLIFVLLYLGGQFCISRNFRLQKVGTADWIFKNYDFSKVSRFIDELVILNVADGAQGAATFLDAAASIVSEVFVPVALGGAIRTMRDAETYFRNGADKIVVNTLLWQQPEVVRKIASAYGEQALMASVDYRLVDDEGSAFAGQAAPKVGIWAPGLAGLPNWEGRSPAEFGRQGWHGMG